MRSARGPQGGGAPGAIHCSFGRFGFDSHTRRTARVVTLRGARRAAAAHAARLELLRGHAARAAEVVGIERVVDLPDSGLVQRRQAELRREEGLRPNTTPMFS